MKDKEVLRNMLLLLITAMIWGAAFVAQSTGGDAVGPYSFNMTRFAIGSAVLVPVIALLDRLGLSGRKPKTAKEKKTLAAGGIACGVILAAGANLQQIGIYLGTPAGKAGFLTACYIILVPVIGLFLKKKCGWNIWVGVVITVIGLYLLCMGEGSLKIAKGDLLIVVCAFVFALHILVIDHFSPLVDGVRMSCIQFAVAAVISAVPAVFTEIAGAERFDNWLSSFGTLGAWIPILYAGIMSCGVAYTLQIVGQQGVNPTVASLIMSLESVFSVLAGWILLGEKLGVREMVGCILIFGAILLAQKPKKQEKRQ